MCMCGKPIINGEFGYKWNTDVASVYPVNPPSLSDADRLLADEPGPIHTPTTIDLLRVTAARFGC